jgi:hypothetical protein
VLLSDEYSYVKPLPEPISRYEWHDLTFFARPTHEAGEEHLTGFTRALDHLDSPVELRSKSKHRLAWLDVEFSQEDVIREWPNAGSAMEQNEVKPKPPPGLSGGVAGRTALPGLSTRRIAPLPDRELRSWYEKRISELTARNETASGETDWEAAKQQFPGRVTRARLRAVREQFAPPHWKQQGRHSPLRGN